MSGLRTLKKVEYRSVKFSGVEALPHKQKTTTSKKIRAVIRGNHHLTLWEFADEFDIGMESCHQICTEEVQMRHASA